MKKYEVWKSCELGGDYREKTFETAEDAEEFVNIMERYREGWHWRVVTVETDKTEPGGQTGQRGRR